LYAWPYILNAGVTMHAQWQDNTLPPPVRYTLIFDSCGGSAVTAITANAGTVVNKPVDPVRSGYRFSGWFDAAEGGTEYTWPHTLSAGVTMYAQWRQVVSVNVRVWVNETGNILASNNNITISQSGSGVNAANFTAEVQTPWSGVQWYLNGGPVPGSRGTARSITINAADYTKGSYYLGVTVTKDGVPHSTNIYFTVVE
jgi:uncharacterized repeat protein (TIGR02543 family)